MPERACWTCKYFDVEVGHYPCCECIARPLPHWQPNENEQLKARAAGYKNHEAIRRGLDVTTGKAIAIAKEL